MKVYPATRMTDRRDEPLALRWEGQELVVTCNRTGASCIFTANEIGFLLLAVVSATEGARLTVGGRKTDGGKWCPQLLIDLDIQAWQP